jgi:hypothetical protein
MILFDMFRCSGLKRPGEAGCGGEAKWAGARDQREELAAAGRGAIGRGLCEVVGFSPKAKNQPDERVGPVIFKQLDKKELPVYPRGYFYGANNRVDHPAMRVAGLEKLLQIRSMKYIDIDG